jgi:hypothetical protein
MKSRSISDPTPREANLNSPQLEEQIRRRAYELYEQRGKDEGHEVDDWLQAEAEMTGKKKTTAA